jgi:pyridoxamine 5'-phosphate oxidase
MPQENYPQDPIALFTQWYDEAKKLGLKEPGAATIATATKDGIPSARILLLKHFDKNGFCFFTNLTSRKGKEIHDNPNAAVCFFWDALLKQVRIEGTVERVSEKEADDYFARRERGSQIGAWASKQSCVMENEEDLPARIKEVAAQFEGQVIPRPPFWSGFRIVPQVIEFWQNGEFRLNIRIVYTKTSSGWKIERLYP